MRAEEIDFFVHLGDYIYETAGDSSFQQGGGERSVIFDDEAGALPLTAGDGSTFYAARSLDNYRQLYRIFRSDPALQAIHERVPMIAVWDDHEFSDDCHGATATYHDGREDETDPARRNAADQAWFEYMPVDYPDPEFVYDPAVPPPDDISIYRDLEFGRHLHLVMTDLRSRRPDHLVPEDAYPGAVPLDEAALTEVAGDTAAGYDPQRITGRVSALYINDVIADTGSALPPIEPAELDAMPRGLAFHQLFKTSLYGQLGARYLLVHPPFMLYASWLDRQSSGAAQLLMGEAQRSWFLDTMKGSTHTWKVWGNEFCLTPLNIDLTGSFLPETFRQQFQMTAEDWNGAPHERARIIDELAAVDNVVAITGDIHAFYAGTPFSWPGTSEGNRIVEFVGSSVSSATYRSLLVGQVHGDPGLSSVPGIDAFALGIRDLLQGGPNPQMGFAEPGQHGYVVVQVSGDELVAEYHLHPEDLAFEQRYDDPDLASHFSVERFRVLPGSRDLYREIEGNWARWDPTTQQWG